jgi:hypothetical protein
MKTNKPAQVAPVRTITPSVTVPSTKGGKSQQSTEIVMSCGGYLGFGTS